MVSVLLKCMSFWSTCSLIPVQRPHAPPPCFRLPRVFLYVSCHLRDSHLWPHSSPQTRNRRNRLPFARVRLVLAESLHRREANHRLGSGRDRIPMKSHTLRNNPAIGSDKTVLSKTHHVHTLICRYSLSSISVQTFETDCRHPPHIPKTASSCTLARPPAETSFVQSIASSCKLHPTTSNPLTPLRARALAVSSKASSGSSGEPRKLRDKQRRRISN